MSLRIESFVSTSLTLRSGIINNVHSTLRHQVVNI